MRFFAAKNWVAWALVWGLCSCVFETATESPPPEKSLAYSVKVSNENGGLRCSISVRIMRWPGQEPLIFQLPPYYPDNPRMPVPGIDPANIRVEDDGGHALYLAETSASFAQGGGSWISLPREARLLRYEVDLDPADPARFGLPMPGLKPGVQLLDGSLLFILPANGKDLASHWRNPISLSLDWQVPPGIPLLGNSTSDYHSNYQLMFFRGALNPARTFEFTVGAHHVTLYTTDAADTLDLPALAERFRHWIPLLENRLQPLPWKDLWIGAVSNSVYGGLEGMGGYWFAPQYAANAEVALHELTHSFVGVLQGDLDDAWWKEGVADYLGKVLATQDGYYSDSSEAVKGYLLQAFDQVPSVVQYALSDPLLRDRFFHAVDSDYVERTPVDFYTMLYGKGAEAAMLIDAWLLRNSDGRHDLFEVVRLLFRSGTTGFTRQQLKVELDSLSGQDADSLLRTVCDQPGAFPAVRLQQAFGELLAFNRFRPSEFNTAEKRSTGSGKPGEGRKFHSFGKF